jgi:hypothetical protein
MHITKVKVWKFSFIEIGGKNIELLIFPRHTLNGSVLRGVNHQRKQRTWI